ncbi:MAG: nuclear transport factor 2 family protein [Massilia sp.]
MDKLVDTFIQAVNAFDVEGALTLFKSDAIIEDVSVRDAFVGTDGIRHYLEQFFVGYKTASKLLSLEQLDDFAGIVRVDFTGDFGHEIGSLRIKTSSDGLIERIEADLE